MTCKPSELLAKPGAWTKSVFARDKEGNGVNFDAPTACSFCMIGAMKVCGVNTYLNRSRVSNVLWEKERLRSIVTFNDIVAKDVGEVIEVLKEAGL